MTLEQPAGVEWTDQIPPNSADPSLSEGPATNGAESPGELFVKGLIEALLAVDERARARIERDEALAERDRARATAVRLEQELAEMTEASAKEALPWLTARDREGRE